MDRLYPIWWESFGNDLSGAGFQRTSVDSEAERWDGMIAVDWRTPSTGESQHTDHPVQIVLPRGFPFEKPQVVPRDRLVRGSRHQAPGEEGSLCLWPDDEEGWSPETTAQSVLERARRWFVHHHQDDWPLANRPPDLHLYYPSCTHRMLMLTSDDWTPPRESITGRFGIWQKDDIRAFAGRPFPGAMMPPQVHSDRILAPLGLAGRRIDAVGLWFRLKREPAPRYTLDRLLEEIDVAAGQEPGWAAAQMQGLLGIKVRGAPVQAVLALGYPGSNSTGPGGGQEQWLFLKASLLKKDGEQAGRAGQSKKAKSLRWMQPDKLQRIRIESFETAPANRMALMRRTEHTAAALQGRRVLVFGVGAIGSSVALLLAMAGLPKLHLIDGDRLRPGNAVRHAGGLSWVGILKTMAVELEIRESAPDCQVECGSPTWDPAALGGYVRGADLIVDATANASFSLLLNEVCLRSGQAALYITAHRRAAVGRLRVVRPRQDACLVCYLDDSREYPFIPRGPEGEFLEEGCGTTTVEASAVDTEAAANATARASLWHLQGKQGPNNQCLIVNDVLPEAPGILSEIGIHWQQWTPVPGCEACGSLADSTET